MNRSDSISTQSCDNGLLKGSGCTSLEFDQIFKGVPGSTFQSDARPTDDQEVAGLIPIGLGNILSWRLIMKYFLQAFSPFRCFKKGKCQFLANEYAQVLVNPLRGLSLSSKSVVS